MTITASVSTAFKQLILNSVSSDVFYLALYTSTANLSAFTSAYTPLGECSGTNYTAGGTALSGAAVTTNGATVGLTFANPVFPTVTIADVRGYMIYDQTRANTTLCVFDFGQSFSFTIQSIEILLPTPGINAGTLFFQ